MSNAANLLLFALLNVETVTGQSQNFDPYAANGGLVTAVAGKDYVLTATDTRLVGPTGYDILERDHLRSRLWSATSLPPPTPRGLFSQKQHAGANGHDDDDDVIPTLVAEDGSLKYPPNRETKSSSPLNSPPVLIASAGCQADCEMLKRVLRSEVRRSVYWGELQLVASSSATAAKDDPFSSSETHYHVSPVSIAVLLSQTLYQRRGFPWYAFCLVAGLSSPLCDDDDDMQQEGGGQVYSYDAIGSYEAVAVSSAGSGNHLLQPILDRSFTTAEAAATTTTTTTRGSVQSAYQSGGIRVPRFPRVQESAQEAADILIRAYRAVSEREASVGDSLVLCCLQRSKPTSENGNSFVCWTQSSPLKTH